MTHRSLWGNEPKCALPHVRAGKTEILSDIRIYANYRQSRCLISCAKFS
jgi:hypothetical protein